MKKIHINLGILIFALFFSQFALAEDIGDMLQNSSKSWSAGIHLTKGLAVLAGVLMSGGALFKMIEISKGHSSAQLTIKVPIVMFFAGAALITIGTQIEMISATLLLDGGSSTEDIFGSGGSSGVDSAISGTVGNVVLFIQLVGNISFFRGLYLCKDVAEKKEKFGKVALHVVGGAMCINIVTTASIFFNTFAPQLGALLGLS